jgi:hypothetical protein
MLAWSTIDWRLLITPVAPSNFLLNEMTTYLNVDGNILIIILSDMMGATRGSGIAYPYGLHVFVPIALVRAVHL